MTQGIYKWSKTASSNAGADSSINWAEGQAPSTVNDSARAMMARIAEYRDDTSGSLTTSGTSTAYTLTTNEVFDSLADMDGKELSITFHTTSGASPTLAVDGLAAKPINVSASTAVGSGVILGNSVWPVVYNNSSGVFLLKGVPASVQDSTVNTNSVASSAVTYSKIQNVSASRLLGNPTGSTAAPSEISLGAGLSFSGTSLVSTVSAASVQGFLSGLTLSTAGGSGTFGIAAGVANDSTNTSLMSLASAYTKTTASWVVGSSNGGLDTGAIANSTWYHVYLIQRPDTGVVDVIFSLSASSPTLPTNYTLFRRIGSIRTDASAHWILFTQLGDEFIWATPTADVVSANLLTTPTLETLTVPTGIKVQAEIWVYINATGAQGVLIFSPDITLTSGGAAGSTNILNYGASGNPGASQMTVRTNTSGQVKALISNNTSSVLWITTYGWIDTRGK